MLINESNSLLVIENYKWMTGPYSNESLDSNDVGEKDCIYGTSSVHMAWDVETSEIKWNIEFIQAVAVHWEIHKGQILSKAS